MNKLLSEDDIINFIGKIADAENTEVYVVGGYIRNELLGMENVDIDFLVVGNGISFAKKVTEKLESSALLEFPEFGTASLWYEGLKIEFATARKEVYEPNSRKPKVNESGIYEDLKRRDFTINTLARKINAESKNEVINLFDGIEDLRNKIIRTPINPSISFSDDPLRMLRAIRFATQFGFKIEKSTLNAIRLIKERINIVSIERISDEIMKILSLKKPSVGFKLLKYVGILKLILPEIDDLSGVENQEGYLHKDVFLHTLKVVDNVSKDSENLNLRFTALMHDVAKPITKKFLSESGWTFYGHDELGAKMVVDIVKRMKLPNHLGEYAKKLIRMHLRPIFLSEEQVTDSAIRRFIVEAGNHLEDLMILCRADITSGNIKKVMAHLQNFNHVIERVKIVEEKDKLREFKSPVDGFEIMKICNLKPGKKIGILKKMIEEAILEGIIPNDHDNAYEYLLKIKNNVILS